jgi:hypothetical protein
LKATAILVAAAQCFAAADQSLQAGGSNEAIRTRLEGCLADSPAHRASATAMACYEQTLWAASFFASRRRGVTLERARNGYPKDFEALLEEVYRSDKEEANFRRDWFVDCVLQPAKE